MNPFVREKYVVEKLYSIHSAMICICFCTEVQFILKQALRVPEASVQSTVNGSIKCSQTNISGDTDHLQTWLPPYNGDLI